MLDSEVKITQKFRGGSVSYREADNEIPFEWEFGGNVVAIICGTKKHVWDVCHPWAAGRQSEVYHFVANEVIRQKAPETIFIIDLAAGTITIL